MELFDKKFVHFMWDNELEGKEGFFADNISRLTVDVNTACKKKFHKCKMTPTDVHDGSFPFGFSDDGFFYYKFFYYDPNYEVKKAYTEGKQIQYKFKDDKIWYDISSSDEESIKVGGMRWFDDNCEYRVKPELATKRMTYLQLAEWLAKGNGQQSSTECSIRYTYQEVVKGEENNEVPADYVIRRWGSEEWIAPTADVYFNDCFVRYSRRC